jgi:outer membrane protein assembly factor BamB
MHFDDQAELRARGCLMRITYGAFPRGTLVVGWLASCALVCPFLAPRAHAAVTPIHVRQFRSSDAAGGDEFGRAVALDQQIGLVGAPGRDDASSNGGGAYLFDVFTGQQLRKLTATGLQADDYFGISVDLDGPYAVVGAIGDDTTGRSNGAAYIFDVATGQQLHKLTPSDLELGAEFGVSVAVDDGIVLVGAHMDGSGSAYLFDAATGVELGKLRSSDAAPDDLFGVAVAIDAGKALIGARYDDDGAIAAGAAYLFDVATQSQVHKLTAHDPARGDRFGMHLDLQGNRAVVGSRYDDDAVKSSGSAYVYDVATGEQLFKLVPGDTTRNDQFGSAVSIHNEYVVIGAVDDDHNGVYAGSAYLFNVNTGAELFKFNAPDAMPFDRMGMSVAIDGQYVAIGASMLDFVGAPELASGKVYTYVVPFLIPEPSGIAMWGTAVLPWLRLRRRSPSILATQRV